MKILSIGDIHGKVSQKWISFIKKEKFDVIVCNGDYFPFTYSKLWFEKCFGTDSELWEIVGEEKYCKAVLNDLKKGAEAIKKLDSLNIPILTVLGNHDESKANVSPDTIDSKEERNERDKEEDGFLDKILVECKNLKRIDYSYAKQGQFIFIGMNGGSFPGHPKSKAYKKSKKKLEEIFKKFEKENKEGRIILVSHNSPYNTKLDKLGDKAHESVRGEHYGTKLSREIIEKYQPFMSLSGHIDEGKGVDLIGKTICINSGPFSEGHGAIILANSEDEFSVRLINVDKRPRQNNPSKKQSNSVRTK